MSSGFLIDRGYGTEEVATWQGGEPRKAWWLFGSIRKGDAERREVNSWRCDRCGLLKSYAE